MYERFALPEMREVGARRMVCLLYRSNDRLVIVRYLPMPQAIARSLRLHEDVARAHLRSQRVADTPQIDSPQASDGTIKGYVGMTDADQIGVAVTQHCAQFVIIQPWMDTGAVVAPRGGMHTQQARAIGQRHALLKGETRQPG